MKTSIPLLLLTVSALSWAVANEPATPPPATKAPLSSKAPSSLPQATVELPWTDFRGLWENAHPVAKSPPLSPDHAVLESRFVLDWSADPTHVAASWVVENYSTEPRWVTVLPSDALLGPSPERKAAFPVSRQSDGLAVLLSHQGQSTFETLLLATKEKAPEGREVIRFPLGSPGITVVEMRHLPGDLEVTLPGGVALKKSQDSQTFVVPVGAKEAALVIKPAAQHQETVWDWQAEAVVHAEPALLKYAVRVSATPLSGDGRILRLPVPAGLRAPRIEAPGVASWNVLAGEPARIEIVWHEDSAHTRHFVLEYEQPLAFAELDWNLLTPLRSDDQSPTLLAILASQGLEIIGEGLRETADGRPASSWLRDRLTGREFVLLESSGRRTVQAHVLPLAEPAHLLIPRLVAATRMVRDGSVLTEIDATVQASAVVRWSVTLPPQAELLRCLVEGETVRPVRRGEALEIPVTPSTDGKAIRIVFSYTQQLPPLDAVTGGVVLALPHTAEFMDLVEWRLEWPTEYAVAGLESSAEILSGEPGQPLQLRQQLVRGSHIQVGIFYRKRGLD